MASKYIQFNKVFIENYNENIDVGYRLDVDVQYREELHELHNDSSFLLARMKILKIEKLLGNMYNKKNVLYTWKI